MNVGICKLCLQQKELCDSHIVPEFLYQELYDPAFKNRIRVLHSAKDGDDRPLQKGIKEHMLCRNCEGKFFEREVSLLFFGQSPLIRREAGTYAQLPYGKLKIFLMSILWRA